MNSKSAKIVNGTACGNLQNSPVVRVAVFDAAGQPLGLCSGTMIESNKVLTAAHCVPNGTTSGAVVYGNPGNTSTVFASRIAVNPKYIPSSISSPGFAAFNDVAVLTLRSSLPLPTSAILGSGNIRSGDEIAIFGYGTDENGEFDFADLKSGEMLVEQVTNNHISAIFNGDGSNTCQGDSGGPAYIDLGNEVAVAGVTSTGTVQDCSEGDNSLFINLSGSDVLDFIVSEAPNARVL